MGRICTCCTITSLFLGFLSFCVFFLMSFFLLEKKSKCEVFFLPFFFIIQFSLIIFLLLPIIFMMDYLYLFYISFFFSLCCCLFFFFHSELFVSLLFFFFFFSYLLFSLCWFSGALILLPESKRMWNQCLMWIYSVLHDIFLLFFCLLQIIMVYKPFQAFQRDLYYQTGKIKGCQSFKGTNSLSEVTEYDKVKQ